MLCLPFEPCTKMRSSLTAREPYPSPRLEIDQTSGGPEAGHCGRRPDSFDRPLRSGPRHCGQSAGGAGDWPATPIVSARAKTMAAKYGCFIEKPLRQEYDT